MALIGETPFKIVLPLKPRWFYAWWGILVVLTKPACLEPELQLSSGHSKLNT